MTTHNDTPHVLLIPGHWLGGWAWEDVARHLADAGAPSTSLTLPGLDPDDPERSRRTLTEQVAAIEQHLVAASAPLVIVAHSGANGPVSLAVDHHPSAVCRVIWVDSGPATPGNAFAPDFPAEGPGLPLPPFDDLGQQASLEGLSSAMLDRFRERAVPEPAGVLRAVITLTDEARLAVSTTLVCCSISSAQVRALAASGHPMFAEVARLRRAEFVDLPTGHWPMWSRPGDLAEIIAEAVARPEASPVG